jgi:hypothetical protein
MANGIPLKLQPEAPRVRLTTRNGIARVAASALVRFAAIARATIALQALLVQLVDVGTELSDLWVQNNRPCGRVMGFDDIM